MTNKSAKRKSIKRSRSKRRKSKTKSKSKRRKSRIKSKSKRRKSRTKSRSKRRKSRTKYRSKRRKSRTKSRSKRRTKSRSKRRKSRNIFKKKSKFPLTDDQIRQRVDALNLNYQNAEVTDKIWKNLLNLSMEAGKGKSREGLSYVVIFGKSVDDQLKTLDQLDVSGESYFELLLEKYGQNPTAFQVYEFIVAIKTERAEIESVVGTDKKGRACSDKCKLYEGNNCYCRLLENGEFSQCRPEECGVTSIKDLLSSLLWS